MRSSPTIITTASDIASSAVVTGSFRVPAASTPFEQPAATTAISSTVPGASSPSFRPPLSASAAISLKLTRAAQAAKESARGNPASVTPLASSLVSTSRVVAEPGAILATSGPAQTLAPCTEGISKGRRPSEDAQWEAVQEARRLSRELQMDVSLDEVEGLQKLNRSSSSSSSSSSSTGGINALAATPFSTGGVSGVAAKPVSNGGVSGIVARPARNCIDGGIAAKPVRKLSSIRLQRPHGAFPFDVVGARAWRDLLQRGFYGLAEDLIEELIYVEDHCAVPPFPWGHIIYHDLLLNSVIDAVEGDFAEFGVGEGGNSVFFARLAKKYGRKFLAVDQFEDAMCRDTVPRFLEYTSKFDIEDVLYVWKSAFQDVQIPNDIAQLAFVHINSDLYDSVYRSLEKVWDLVPEGGVIAVDKFFHHSQGPARAVSDFFQSKCGQDESPLLYVVPCYSVIIIKGRSACLWMPDVHDSTKGLQQLMHSQRALDGNFYSFKLMRQCAAFLEAVEHSVQRSAELLGKAKSDRERAALRRCVSNAESFLDFLCYPDDGARSGCDVMRYLLPLEDALDVQ